MRSPTRSTESRVSRFPIHRDERAPPNKGLQPPIHSVIQSVRATIRPQSHGFRASCGGSVASSWNPTCWALPRVMDRTYWLIPDRLCGRPGPAIAPWSLPDLRSAGIQSILSLAAEQSPLNLADEGFRYARVPIPPQVPPDRRVERACFASLPSAVEFVRSELEAGRCLLVHCAAGRDRTALVLAGHLASESGVSATEAIATVRQARPDALTAEGWEALAQRVISHLWG